MEGRDEKTGRGDFGLGCRDGDDDAVANRKSRRCREKLEVATRRRDDRSAGLKDCRA